MNNAFFKIEGFFYGIIHFALWLVEVILILRFALKLLGANGGNALIQAIYSMASALLGPFNNIFYAVSFGNAVFEPSVLIAMIFYAFVAYLLASLIRLLSSVAESDRANINDRVRY